MCVGEMIWKKHKGRKISCSFCKGSVGLQQCLQSEGFIKRRDLNVPPDKNASINRDSRRTGCTERWEVEIPGTSLMISICKTRVGSDKELAEIRHVDKNYGILQVIYEDSRPESGLWWCRKTEIAAKCLCMEKLQEITVFYWYGGMKLKIEINLIYTK